VAVEPVGGGALSTTILVVIVVVAVVILLLALFFASRRRAAQRSEEQRERSREEFGPEYERTVQKRGSEEDAERELRERRGRVERQIGPLSEQSLAVMHPDVADDYREARRVRAEVVARTAGRSDEDQGEESTEDLRQAIRRYRTVYELLVRQ
jgi:FtsZ-interacting cell division protein ZipA